MGLCTTLIWYLSVSALCSNGNILLRRLDRPATSPALVKLPEGQQHLFGGVLRSVQFSSCVLLVDFVTRRPLFILFQLSGLLLTLFLPFPPSTTTTLFSSLHYPSLDTTTTPSLLTMASNGANAANARTQQTHQEKLLGKLVGTATRRRSPLTAISHRVLPYQRHPCPNLQHRI